MRQLSLKYLPDFEGEGVYFELTDKLADNFKVVGFDISYRQSYQYLCKDSGVYILGQKTVSMTHSLTDSSRALELLKDRYSLNSCSNTRATAKMPQATH